MEDKDWFRRRNYPHFDREVSPSTARRIVHSPERVAHHAFFPLIKRENRSRHYKRNSDGDGLAKAKGKVTVKRRPICYAAHLDAHIYSYYAQYLRIKYEEALSEKGLTDYPLAYRKIKDKDGNGKCNIHFARDVFKFIQSRNVCIALALDISGFFDNLNHELLKDQWARVLGTDRLPSDHFKVFRSVTSYAYVTERRLRQVPICKKFYSQPRTDQRGQAVCSGKIFRREIRGQGLVHTNSKAVGIPQGLPISPVLSNLYMLPFDEKFSSHVRQYGGMYCRYSDDIFVACPPENACKLLNKLESELKDLLEALKLHINSAKTERVEFRRMENGQLEFSRLDNKAGPFQYLGFEFDGRNVRLRAFTTTRYNRRMQRAVRRAEKSARLAGETNMRKAKLYERFSHLGSRNFIDYANRACRIMGDDSIKKQVRNHWSALNHQIRKRSRRLQ